jgi:hypothetical protein
MKIQEKKRSGHQSNARRVRRSTHANKKLVISPRNAAKIPRAHNKCNSQLFPWLMMVFQILTYHASNTMRAEETLTTSCTLCRSKRQVL